MSASGLRHGYLARQVTADGSYDFASLKGRVFRRVRLVSQTDPVAAAGVSGNGELIAPVPGKVVAIKTAPGSAVEDGQAVFVLESMKMEFEVKASRSGTINEILVATGEQVKAGVRLATWKQ